MHANDEEFTGEYQFTMKSYKIPMKKPCPSTAIAIPPVPGTEDVILAPNAAESPTKPSHTETYTSPLAALDPPPPKPASVSQPIGHATNNSAPAQQPAKPATNKRPTVPATDGLPDELVKLFKPLCCDLCSTKLNSPITARHHYESKNHEKKTTAWLAEWSLRSGEPIPKRNKPIERPGASSTHCEVCDLPLTSIQHAKQHYMGRKHRNAVAGRGKPTGKGYFDANNQWVRTKCETDPANRFGIGESFLANKDTDEAAATEHGATTPTDSEMTGDATPILAAEALFDGPPPLPAPSTAQQPPTASPDEVTLLQSLKVAARDLSKYCELCDISVNLEAHMRLHLVGAKHAKKLRQMGEPPYQEVADTISQSLNAPPPPPPPPAPKRASAEHTGGFDYSVFRTPSGQYYCNVCNLSVSSEVMLAQHMASKKHIKTLSTSKRK